MEIPQNWRDALAIVQGVFPGSMIAGGAMRDLANDRPIKDVDLMVSVPDLTFDDVYSRIASLPEFVIQGANDGQYVGGWQDEVLGYIDTRFRGEDVQIVAVTTSPEQHLTRLDFGICQIGFDGERVHFTDAYAADVADQAFTFARCDTADQRARSLRRYQRLQTKYPGWVLRDQADLLAA